MNILTLPDQPSALLAIKSGRAVGDLTDHSTAGYIARTTNNGNTFQLATDPASPDGYSPSSSAPASSRATRSSSRSGRRRCRT